jgi:class 3 adenylate cyclase
VDADAFEAAGLYDPDAADAANRLELLTWLSQQGVGLDELVDAASRGRLTGLAGDLVIRPGARLTLAQITERSGLSEARVQRIRRAAGLPTAPYDAAVFTEDDVNLFAAFELGASLFGDAAMLQFVRVLGSSLARLAEAVVFMFVVNVEKPLMTDDRGQFALARANLEAAQALNAVPEVMNILFREHVEETIRRSQVARTAACTFDDVHMAIGFVDLVGFTPLSQAMDTAALAQLVDEFEATAFDLVAEHDGRVVKLIGDEVMFATVSAAAACEVALGLAGAYSGESAVTPRGAVAVGDVLSRAGDYYGPVVNLASRAAALAVPNEILTTREVRDETLASDAALAFQPAGRRSLKGFAEPVELFTVDRG